MYTPANKIQITMLSDHLLNFFFSKSNIYKMYVLHQLSKWMGKKREKKCPSSLNLENHAKLKFWYESS